MSKLGQKSTFTIGYSAEVTILLPSPHRYVMTFNFGDHTRHIALPRKLMRFQRGHRSCRHAPENAHHTDFHRQHSQHGVFGLFGVDFGIEINDAMSVCT